MYVFIIKCSISVFKNILHESWKLFHWNLQQHVLWLHLNTCMWNFAGKPSNHLKTYNGLSDVSAIFLLLRRKYALAIIFVLWVIFKFYPISTICIVVKKYRLYFHCILTCPPSGRNQKTYETAGAGQGGTSRTVAWFGMALRQWI